MIDTQELTYYVMDEQAEVGCVKTFETAKYLALMFARDFPGQVFYVEKDNKDVFSTDSVEARQIERLFKS